MPVFMGWRALSGEVGLSEALYGASLAGSNKASVGLVSVGTSF
jgi:hypothetical protein